MSSILDKIKQLFLTKSEKPIEVNPWEETTPATSPASNPWKTSSTPKAVPAAKAADVWVSPRRGLKEAVLRKVSFLLIILNVGIGLFFYSNNMQFNLALYAYLGTSTLVIGHYISLTR